MNTLNLLLDAKARISDPDHWFQGADSSCSWSAVDKNNVAIEPNDPNACKWCGVGTLLATTDKLDINIYYCLLDLVDNRAKQLYKYGIIGVNDKIGHAAVMNVYDSLINECGEKI